LDLKQEDWFNWCGICQCIRKSKIYLDEQNDQMNPDNHILRVGDAKLETVTTRQIYKSFLEISNISNTEIRISKYVAIPQNENPEHIFIRCHKYVLDTYTKAFQYKFLYDILVNNYWLTKWKIQDNNLCTFCNNHEENIYHLYWDCAYIRTFWLQFNTWINYFTPIETTANLVFYGIDNHLLYTLITLAKRFIHDCRKNNITPDFTKFTFKVKYLRKLESMSMSDLIFEKWEPLQNFV